MYAKRNEPLCDMSTKEMLANINKAGRFKSLRPVLYCVLAGAITMALFLLTIVIDPTIPEWLMHSLIISGNLGLIGILHVLGLSPFQDE